MAEGAAALGAVETSTPVEATPVESTPVETTPVEGAEQSQPVEGAEQQTTEQPEGAEVDLFNVPQLVNKAIQQLKASDPAAARALRDYFHQQQAWAQEFPGGVKEARELKQTIEMLGGTEGIQSLQAEKSEWDAIDSKFANGDASVLDTFAQFNPEGFAKIIPAAVQKLATLDRDAYNHTLSPVFVSTLDNWQLPQTLDALIGTLSQVVDQNGNALLSREVQALDQLRQNYAGLRDLAQKVPEKKVDPEREKFESEKKAFEQQKVEAFRAEVGEETQKYAASKYEALIQAETKAGIKLPESGTRSYQTMLREIDSEIARELGKDKATMQKLNALDATAKKADLVAFLNAQFDRVAPKVVQKVCREWTSTKNPQPKPAAKPANNPNGNTVVKMNQPPNPQDIDYTKTTRQDVMNGRAYLKGRNGLHVWME